MNLGDPELELLDPTPDVHLLFVQFDKMFFETRLISRAVVRWSKKMYSCAGVCTYQGRAGLCDIALSEPLLKLRPRKDIVETLLHEMIHAYLFITSRDQDRDGHGPNFKFHMHRINKAAGLNISIYHDFHDEVKLYQTHWWRCNGPCQSWRPYYGIIRKSANIVPGPKEHWWESHQRRCGGQFIKIKEPEKKSKKKTIKKPNADITKYITNNVKTINDTGTPNNKTNKVLKTINNNIPIKIKSTSPNTFVMTKYSPKFNPKATPPSFNGIGQTIGANNKITINNLLTHTAKDVSETVRSIWANKQIPFKTNEIIEQKKKVKVKTHGNNNSDSNEPPSKKTKIDDYFKNTASALLKDIYGQDFKITQTDTKIFAAVSSSVLVDCPICCTKIDENVINSHVDECLNKDIIKQLAGSNINTKPLSNLPAVPKTKLETHKDIEKINKDVIKQLPGSDINTKPLSNLPAVPKTKLETHKDIKKIEQKCPCCGIKLDIEIHQHLDECLAFSLNTTVNSEAKASTSLANVNIICISDDEDICDETQTMNATGTKTPCPCCLEMVEDAEMNDHLDICLK